MTCQERNNIVGEETDSIDTDSMDSDIDYVIADAEGEKLDDLNDLINKILDSFLDLNEQHDHYSNIHSL